MAKTRAKLVLTALMCTLINPQNPQAASTGRSKGLGIKHLIVVEDRLCPHDIALKSFSDSTHKLIMHGVSSNGTPSRSLTPSPLTPLGQDDGMSSTKVNFLDQNQGQLPRSTPEKGGSNTDGAAKSDSSSARRNSDSQLQVHTSLNTDSLTRPDTTLAFASCVNRSPRAKSP